ncbi:hypothetical protein C1H76_5898 [Elsinoe australis]|uniref:Uncharacterized protein n=1 Tax=Elsinoe australis TaxID=40998 RepID=A0A2P8AFU7_9PEZI|nr:hypothetical protein B9Z65_3668 [Elsinoe australis]TKX22005.1 hypothetical protein C1H76_5898 [Elsinoe australis]
MASFYHPGHSYGNSMSGGHNHNHHGRSRRGPRGVSSSHHAHRQQHLLKQQQRSPKQPSENPAYTAYIKDLEAARSFDLEDDEVFCPVHLLTEDDLQSMHSSSASDRSSLSSASPEASPLQQQVHPNPSFLVSGPASYNHNAYHQNRASQQHTKVYQPVAQRHRSAIPIVDPSTRSVASPPPSVSPARQMQHQYARRW